MKYIGHTPMRVTCKNCKAIFETSDRKDFKESNTYPPLIYFWCTQCDQKSQVNTEEVPQIFALLVSKITKERGYYDSNVKNFNSLRDI